MAIDLDAIEAALVAATPGPFALFRNGPRWAVLLAGRPGALAEDMTEADARLIANSPTWLAALVAEVRALRERMQVEYNAMTHTAAHLKGMVDRLDDENRELVDESYVTRVALAASEAKNAKLIEAEKWMQATRELMPQRDRLEREVERLRAALQSSLNLNTGGRLGCPARAKPSEGSDMKYCICRQGGEIWIDGPFDSIEEASDEAAQRDDARRLTIHEVDEPAPAAWMLNADSICEAMDENAADTYQLEDPLFEIDPAKKREAEEELRAWADKWIEVSTKHFAGRQVVSP